MPPWETDIALRRWSPAFVEYFELATLPSSTPTFELYEGGYPQILPGERFCRLPGPGGVGHCGKRVSTSYLLHVHMEVAHGILKEDRPTQPRGLSERDLDRADEFYKRLMSLKTASEQESVPPTQATITGERGTVPLLPTQHPLASTLHTNDLTNDSSKVGDASNEQHYQPVSSMETTTQATDGAKLNETRRDSAKGKISEEQDMEFG